MSNSMLNLREKLIDAIFESLKIPHNVFNTQLVRAKLERVADDELQPFYQELFSAKHQYLTPLDRISKVTQMFLNNRVDEDEVKAKELHIACEMMHKYLYQKADSEGAFLNDFIQTYEFTTISNESLIILNAVKPFLDFRRLIVSIHTLRDHTVAQYAFKQAIIEVKEAKKSKEVTLFDK